MSQAASAVHAFRNSVPAQSVHLREEVRGNERGRERDESAITTAEGAVTSSFSSHPSSFGVESFVNPLTARQMHAINLLAMGKSVVSTARTLGIGESTLHRWKATHPRFKAELAQRQHNVFDAMIGKLRLTMGKAVDQLFAMMTGESEADRREVMREMLKLLKPEKYLVPSEPMTVGGVLDESVRDARASRGESVATEITDGDRIDAIPAEFRTAQPQTMPPCPSDDVAVSATPLQTVEYESIAPNVATAGCPGAGTPDPRTAPSTRVNEYVAPGHPLQNAAPSSEPNGEEKRTATQRDIDRSAEPDGEALHAEESNTSPPRTAVASKHHRARDDGGTR